jgi:hypothetical protein
MNTKEHSSQLRFMVRGLLLVIALMLLGHSQHVSAQWGPSGNNISNTNPGNVGVGTPTPAQKLSVQGNIGVSADGVIISDADNSNYLKPYESGTGRMVFRTGALDRLSILYNGNVGISTATPKYKLDVQGGSINASGGLCIAGICKTDWSQVAGSGSTQWAPGSGTNSISYSSGNVGIGTTNPLSNLQIGSLTSTGTSNPATFSLGATYSNLAGSNFKLKLYEDGVPTNTYGIGVSSGSMDFATAPSGGYTWYSGGLNRMTLTGNGSVGIGTATPNTVDTLELSAFGNKGLHFLNSGGGARLSVTGNGNASTDFVDSNAAANQRWFVLQNIAGKAYYRGLSDAGAINYDLMTFDLSNGKIGIGFTNPAYKLDVNGTINATGILVNGSPISSGGASQWTSGSNSISYSAGNVGIGTIPTPSSPYKLDVNGTINATNILVNGAPISSGSASQWTSGTNSISYSSGNVGIGTPGTSYKLDVNGSTNVTGNLNVGGTGNINATGTITGGNIVAKYQDVAEWVRSSEGIPAGTVVVLDVIRSNQVVRSMQAYDTRVAGVISERPGIALGERGESKVLVATTGRVLVQVDASNGPIHIGDLLVTSDVPGMAMKSTPVNLSGVQLHRPGTLIGKALEPLEKGSGKILVLLSLQ